MGLVAMLAPEIYLDFNLKFVLLSTHVDARQAPITMSLLLDLPMAVDKAIASWSSLTMGGAADDRSVSWSEGVTVQSGEGLCT